MSSNLFAQPSKNDIKVGYIDPQLGYVSDVTICEANEYAQKNPGTTFLFKNGNRVLQYLNINEVNNLTIQDLESNRDCEGINQKERCGPPNIQFYGGSGIGALGNPIIGNDGSILAVDLVRGGHGYQYPPQVSANDHCNYGAGAVLTAVLGETSEQYETYESEDEFEEYELCDSSDVGFGRRYGPNGEDLGLWEPSNYTRIGGDPIKREIDEYERIVRLTERKPFWTTRKNRPNKITASDPKVTPTQAYNVTFESAWNEFMNSHAISPVPPSNVKGSDYSGILFTLEWNQEFPVEGEYIFRGLCDNIAQLYLDNEKVADLASFSDSVREIRKNVSKGIHNIRVDLLNVPIKEKNKSSTTTESTLANNISAKFIQKNGKYFLEVTGTGSGEVSFVMDVNDASYIAGLAAKEIRIPSDSKKVLFKRTPYKYSNVANIPEVLKEETIKNSGMFTAGKTYGPIEIIGASAGVKTPKVSNNKLSIFDTQGTDENIKLIITGVKNNISTNSSVVSTSSITSSTASIKRTNVFNTIDYINKADRKLWRINSTAGPNSDFLTQYGISPFDTTTKEAKTDSFAGTHLIRWQSINFPIDGNYNIDIMVDDNVTLYIGNASTGGKIDDGSGLKKDEIVIKKTGFSGPGKSTGKTTESRYFMAGNYRIRAELEQIEGKALAKGNPMALAINIDVATVSQEVVSSKSWNENPMGVSLTIDAPEPTVPQESVPEQEGRCPNNPFWTTRFPASSEKWYPVNYPGPRKITETITNFTPTDVTSDKQEVEFTIYGQGAFKDIYFTFTSVDGKDSFNIRGVDKNKKTRKEKIKILKNVAYVVKAKEDSTKFNSVEQGLIKGGTKDKESAIGTSNKIFADYTASGNDNDDIQITVALGTFTSSNRRKAKNSNRNTYDLTYKLDAAPTVKNTASTTTKTYDAPGWSRFMNRYAISPVKPLDIPGSDKSGATYSTSWDIDIPYDGFYGIKGTRDNKGRILVDNTEVSKLDGFNVESPKLTKIFLTKGRHKITAEVYNQPVTSTTTIDQKIFRTKDWQVSGTSTSSSSSNISAKFIQKNGKYFLEVTGTGSGEVSFVMDVNDASYIAGLAAKEISIPSDKTDIKFKRTPYKYSNVANIPEVLKEETIKNSGKFTAGKTYGPIKIIGASAGVSTPKVSNNKLSIFDTQGTDENIKLIITGVKNSKENSITSTSGYLSSGTTKDGVVYEGPTLFHYNDSKWGSFMNSDSLSPYLPPLGSENLEINGIKRYTWKNVKFPESGQYKVFFQADNVGNLYIGGNKVLSTTDFTGVPIPQDVNITSGTYDISIEVDNTEFSKNVFTANPTGFGLVIQKNITSSTDSNTSWAQNPMGISAILVPPPCPKKISGRGVVKEVLVEEPGNGYFPSGTSTNYPVSLRLKSVLIETTGINYRCGEDKIQITPSNGAVLDYKCDSFGRIVEVSVINPGLGFTEYPNITIPSETGINASFIPQFEVVRDPIVIDTAKLIQVTDLVGLKQNGYIDGRAYYGSVFYKDGVRYAGFYETPGELVQVYATLQESIDANVTTQASAIQRSGTDTELSSNNPKLNIPNTPENLI